MKKIDEFAHSLATKLADILAEKIAERLASSRRFLSPTEYAATRSLGKRTVYRAIADGKLPYKRSGRRILIEPDADIAA